MKLKELLKVVPDNYLIGLMDSDPDNYLGEIKKESKKNG